MNPDSREELGTRPQIELDEERARAALHRTSERRQGPPTLWLVTALVVVALVIIALVAF